VDCRRVSRWHTPAKPSPPSIPSDSIIAVSVRFDNGRCLPTFGWLLHGDRHREAALENNLADLHHAAGADDEAMIHLKRAVAIFTEVGADEATRLPEIWKLVSW
jgi:hypothetical protein